MRRAASAMVVSGDTVTKFVVITDLAGIVMCTAPVRKHAQYRIGLAGALTYRNLRWNVSLSDTTAHWIKK
jgi:hypothetical protein